LSTQPDIYRFGPDEDKEREQVKEDYSIQGWSVEEIPDGDGSGAVTLVFTPPGYVSPPVDPPGPRPLAWGAKVSAVFRNKVRDIAGTLGCDPDFLMAAMAFETGEKFSPGIRNPNSSATGLIQFMEETAKRLGTTINALANMSAEDQLDYVAKYFNDYKGRLETLADVYMAILWPKAVPKDNDYVLFESPSKEYEANKGLDSNKDGMVTKAEAAAKVQVELDKGRLLQFVG